MGVANEATGAHVLEILLGIGADDRQRLRMGPPGSEERHEHALIT